MVIKDWHWTRLLLLWVGGSIAAVLIVGLADAYKVERPPAPEGVLLGALVYGIAIAILAITGRWLWARGLARQVLIGLGVIVSVFLFAFYVARSEVLRLGEDSIPFAIAATILATFLYWRVSKRIGL